IGEDQPLLMASSGEGFKDSIQLGVDSIGWPDSFCETAHAALHADVPSGIPLRSACVASSIGPRIVLELICVGEDSEECVEQRAFPVVPRTPGRYTRVPLPGLSEREVCLAEDDLTDARFQSPDKLLPRRVELVLEDVIVTPIDLITVYGEELIPPERGLFPTINERRSRRIGGVHTEAYEFRQEGF